MKTTLKIIVPLLLVALAYLGAKQMIASKPELQSKQPPTVIPKVSTVKVSPATHAPPVDSFGTVQSYFETTVTPQVSGAITHVSPNFRVGMKVKQGALLATIDRTDFHAAAARAEATLSTHKRQLAEEQIRAQQAKSDWLSSGRPLDSASPFVLRKPQLAAAKANVQSSKSALDKALRDIKRCEIKAEFDAVVVQRSASVGNYATPQSPLGKIVATERAELRLPLTPEQSARIQLPHNGSSNTKIKLTSPARPNHTWTATLKRTDPVIDPQNQVVYVIAEITTPYSSKAPLLVGTFVNARIPSLSLENTLEIPEEALVNDSYLWAIDGSDQLVKLTAKRLHSHQGMSYVRLIDSPLKAPFSIVSRPLTNFRSKMKVAQEATSNKEL